MTVKYLQRSFAGGEITPELYARLDLTKFQTGVALARNMIVLPHGPLTRRPGTEFCAEAHDSNTLVRVVPFTFNSTQTAVLEFGHQYVRVMIDGGLLVESGVQTASISGSTVFTTAPHGYAAGDNVQIGVRTLVVGSVPAADRFTVQDHWGTLVVPVSLDGYCYRVYKLATPYDQNDLFDLRFTQDADVVTITHPSYAARELRRNSATNWTLTAVSFAPALSAPTNIAAPATAATPTNMSPQTYTVTAVGADGVSESLAGTPVTAINNLDIAGNYNTVTWDAVVGASRYNVYKNKGGSFGWIGQTTNLSTVDDNVTPDTLKSPPEDIITLNGSAGDYPTAVAHHEQRRWFGGSNNAPQGVWATRSGTTSNLTSSIPSQDADGMAFRVAAGQYNQILHLVPLGDLIAFTAGAEFRLFADGAPAITPTSLSVKPQGFNGASKVQPITTGNSALYVQARGSRVREMSYSWEAQSYKSTDTSILAPHLFDGYTIRQMAYQHAPNQILWAVRDDGALLGMTYVPDQQVYAWHQHDTAGEFESCCVVTEDGEDVLYVVVRRLVAGRGVRYIERMHPLRFTDAEHAIFVDSSASYDGGPPGTTIGGFWHLQTAPVDILADGAVANDTVSTLGQIELDVAASVVHVGTPVTADVQLLPLAVEAAAASGQGAVKNVNKVHLRVTSSSTFKVGPSFDAMRVVPGRDVSDPYDSAPALTSGTVTVAIDPDWLTDPQVCVRQEDPLPLTIQSMVLEVQLGGS